MSDTTTASTATGQITAQELEHTYDTLLATGQFTPDAMDVVMDELDRLAALAGVQVWFSQIGREVRDQREAVSA